MMSIAKVLAVLLAPLVAAADEKPYPRAGLLIEPAARARARGFVTLDARPRKQYDLCHVTGARWVDAAAWARGFGHGQDAAGWGKRIGVLGVGKDTPVVVYDDNLAKDAARVWWILR